MLCQKSVKNPIHLYFIHRCRLCISSEKGMLTTEIIYMILHYLFIALSEIRTNIKIVYSFQTITKYIDVSVYKITKYVNTIAY